MLDCKREKDRIGQFSSIDGDEMVEVYLRDFGRMGEVVTIQTTSMFDHEKTQICLDKKDLEKITRILGITGV